MGEPIIGVQLYTLREYMQTPEETKAVLRKVAGIGYKHVEPAGFGGMEEADFKAACDDAGLQIVSCHDSWDEMKDEPQTTIDRMKMFGCGLVASGSPASYQNGEGYAEYAKLTTEAGKKLAAGGVTFQYHNHAHEYILYDGKSAMEIMMENSDPEYFKFQLDLCWVARGSASPVAWIKKLAGRIGSLHCKDSSPLSNTESQFEPVGAGNLDWCGIISAAADEGISVYIVEQDRCQIDEFDSIEISYNNLASWLS